MFALVPKPSPFFLRKYHRRMRPRSSCHHDLVRCHLGFLERLFAASLAHLSSLGFSPRSWRPLGMGGPAPRRSHLADLWKSGRDGTLCPLEQAKAWGFREAQRARGQDENLADIARSVVKMGGGHPSRETIRKLFELIGEDEEWHPGKRYGLTINGSTDNLDLLVEDDWLGRGENRVLFEVVGAPWDTPAEEGAPPGTAALSQ